MKLKVAFLATAMLSFAAPAYADLIAVGTPSTSCDTACAQFVDQGALGFGNDPRILSLQTDTYQQGQVAPDGSGGVIYPTLGAPGNEAIQNGNNKGSAPSIGSLGWTTGANVAIGYNSNQSASTGITLQDLRLDLYDPQGNLLHSFDLAPALHGLQYSSTDLALQQGNGNGLFVFALDSGEQALWNTLATSSADTIGMYAAMGCLTGAPVGCQVSNDGADSFLAILGPSAVPLPNAALLFGTGLLGLGLMSRKRRKLA